MASVSTNATVTAKNGLPTTHVLTVDDVSTVSVATALTEAQQEGFTVVAVEDDISSDGCYVMLQGTGTPAVTGTTLVVSFTN